MGARHFGAGEETVWGTPVAPTRIFEALTESVQVERNFESVETIRGFSPIDLVQLNSIVRGDVEVLANYEELGLLYEHLLGGSADTNASGAGFSHLLPPAATGIPDTDRIGQALTLEFRRDGSLSWRYSGCKIVSLSHSFGTDQSSRISFGFIGKGSALAGPATGISFETLNPMFPKEITVNISGTEVPARSVTIDVENPLDETFLLGSDDLAREPDRSGVLRVTGSIEAIYEDNTFYSWFDGTTNVPVVITANKDSVTQLFYRMNKCRLTQATPHNNARDRLATTYEFEAVWYNDSQENLQIELVNSRATP